MLYLSEPEPNLNLENGAQVHLNQTWTAKIYWAGAKPEPEPLFEKVRHPGYNFRCWEPLAPHESVFAFSAPSWHKISRFCSPDFSGATCKLSNGVGISQTGLHFPFANHLSEYSRCNSTFYTSLEHFVSSGTGLVTDNLHNKS